MNAQTYNVVNSAILASALKFRCIFKTSTQKILKYSVEAEAEVDIGKNNENDIPQKSIYTRLT